MSTLSTNFEQSSISKDNAVNWTMLPHDLLEHIAKRLPALLDQLRFRGVCKAWRAAAKSYENISKFSKNDPWLMLYKSNSHTDICYLHDRSCREFCKVNMPLLVGSKCLESRSGWLLLHRNDNLFFYNPLTAMKIDLPILIESIDEKLTTFSSVPTSSDCKVFIVRRISPTQIELSFNCVGRCFWETKMIDLPGSGDRGSLDAVYCCNCEAPGQHTCMTKECVRFGFFRWNVKTGTIGLTMNYNMLFNYGYLSTPSWEESVPVYEEMKNVHSAQWLKEFGEKGFSISFGSLTMKYRHSYNVASCDIITSSDDSGKIVNNVKGVWLEPCLKD